MPPRPPKIFTSVLAARTLVELNVDLVAITDGPLSPIATMTELWCELDVPAVGPFDSSLPSVIAAELLVLEVVRQLGVNYIQGNLLAKPTEAFQTTSSYEL